MPTRNKRHCLTVGITGGIGSGKTLVCAMLESFGRTVLSADELARTLMVERLSLRASISREFGPDVYGPDGSLNRGLLAERAFAHPGRTRALNAIVHPAVVRELLARVRRLPTPQRCPYTVVEAALLFESGLDASLDLVVAVDAPREIRIQRVLERDGTPREAILRRMRSQLAASVIRQQADVVLMNRHDTTTLRSRVAFLDALLVAASLS